MIKYCNCEEIFDTEGDLSDIVEKAELINGEWQATDRMTLSNKVLKVKRKQFEDGLLKFRTDSTHLESVGRNPSAKEMRKYWGEDAYCIRCGSYLYNVSEEIYDYFKENN